LHNVQ